jgi:hypothetical protein
MDLEHFYNEGYVLSDGAILSIQICNENGTIIKMVISTEQYLTTKKSRTCSVLLTFRKIAELNFFDTADILASYSDITILRLEGGNFYASFDPYGNTNKPHEKDNNVIIAEELDLQEIFQA